LFYHHFMSESATSRPSLILLFAIVLGVAGDAFVRAMPWGINVVLGVALLAVLLLVLLRKSRPEALGAAIPAMVGATLTAALVAWHDSPILVALDILFILLFLGLAAFGARKIRLVSSGILRSLSAMVLTALQTAIGPFQLILGDLRWREVNVGKSARLGLALLRGLIIAIPALLIFGALLVSADAAFAGVIKRMFDIDFPLVFSHVFFFCAISALAAGYLRSLSVGGELPHAMARPAFLSLGIVETMVIVGTLDLLFCSFVIVQLRYFFGGAALVKVAPGLTYAQYARHGFFELVTVAALVVPLLLLADWIAEKGSAAGTLALRAASAFMILLVFVMMASALQRMRLYQMEFGMTEQRFYTTAFMFWLAVLLLWLAVTVLRGDRERFTVGAVVSAFIAVLVLNVVDPDAIIARVNFERAAGGKRAVDAGYIASLSADAVPALVQHFDTLPQLEKAAVAKRLLRFAERDAKADWRSWNASRAAAGRVLAPRLAEMRVLAGK
jgi:hypothetical protein